MFVPMFAETSNNAPRVLKRFNSAEAVEKFTSSNVTVIPSVECNEHEHTHHYGQQVVVAGDASLAQASSNLQHGSDASLVVYNDSKLVKEIAIDREDDKGDRFHFQHILDKFKSAGFSFQHDIPMQDILDKTGFAFCGTSSLPVSVGDFPAVMMRDMSFVKIDSNRHAKPARTLKRFDSSAAIEQYTSDSPLFDMSVQQQARDIDNIDTNIKTLLTDQVVVLDD